jgi:tetratricopeptide (TPR) repeat protein
MKWFIIIILALSATDGYTQAERKFVRRGNREYDDKKFQEAEIQYRKALEKDPQSVAADYNLGNALYKQKQYDAAASRYTALTEKQKGNTELNMHFYNLGNTLYEAGKFKESAEAYKNALRRIPGDMDAKHNLLLALKRLQDEQQQNNQDKNQQQQEQKQKQQNQQEQKQNQQKDNQQQDKDKNNQQQQDSNQQQPPEKQNSKGQISPQDAERILQALENEEKNVLKKVQEQQQHIKKTPVDKNW